MITTVVNLFGGPGSGKSTLAAETFAHLKKQGASVELVREYAKDWAYRKQPIEEYDGIYLAAKQLRAESCLYGKVETIITDSPIFIGAVYEAMYTPKQSLVGDFCVALLNHQHKKGLQRINLFVLRNKTQPYDPVGRNETEEQALQVDKLCKQLVGINMAPVRTVEDVVKQLRRQF